MIYNDLADSGRYDVFQEGGAGSLCLKLKGKGVPVSIKNTEFDFLMKTIIDNNLKRGYEMATGVGISALAAGLGFKQTGGKLVTLDAYIEEKSASDHTYRGKPKDLYKESDGFKSINYLIDTYELKDVVIPKIGFSPDDVESCLLEEFPDLKNSEKLDYVFIDGGHWFEAISKDLTVVNNFLQDGCFVFMHDVAEGVFGRSFGGFIKQIFGKDYEVVVPYPEGFNLALVRK